MLVVRIAPMKGEEKREIRIVGVEQIQGWLVEDVVAGNRREERVQKVVVFFIELGVVDTENLVEVGARSLNLGHVEVINDDSERELPEVIAMQLDLLDAFTQFSDLALFRIVEQHILRSRVIHVDLADEGSLGVVKMAALALDDSAHLAGIFLFPFRHDVIIGFHFKQALEDERKALSGRLFERQHFDVIIVYAKMSAMAFDRRFGEIVVEEGVVFEFSEFEFVRMEVERSLENAKGFPFAEHPNSEEVADLEDEAACLLKQRCLGVADVLPQNDQLLLTRKMCPQIR